MVRRILICGPVFGPGTVGGLPLALQELADELSRLGWGVDLAVTADALGIESGGPGDVVLPLWARRAWTPHRWTASLSADHRAWIQHMLLGGGVAAVQSRAMHAIERRLASNTYGAVVGYVSREAPGLAAFLTARHPRVLLLSLNGLAAELRQGWRLHIPRWIARARLHADLYRPVNPSRVRMAVFGSETWRDEAVAAGLRAAAARVIHFGVAPPPPLEPMPAFSGRLLFVGRCSPEKGLHLFLEALALLNRSMALRLTAICGPGPSGYRRFIERRIVELRISHAVTLMPAVPRAELRAHYRTHDVLLFQSAFDTPVALVLMEAFAAGIPVVAPLPAGRPALVVPDETCVCFRTPRPADVAAAIGRLVSDQQLRLRLRTRAHARVAADFSLDAMARAYDGALRELMELPSRTAGEVGCVTQR